MKLTEKLKSFVRDEKKQNIILYVCVAVIMLLWLPLALTKNLAYDQGYTIAMVRHSFGDIIKLCSNDVHSPLYYFITKIFYHAFFNHIIGTKICSLVFMGIYFWMLAVPFKKEFGFRMSLTMIILSGLLPTFLTHNTEPRMYAMAITSFSIVCFLGYKLAKEFKVSLAIWFFIASVFSTYIHTYTMLCTVFIYLFLAIAIIMNKEDRKRKITWFLVNALVVSLCYLPWLFSLVSQFGKKAEGVNTEFDSMYFVKDILYEFFSSITYPKDWQVWLWLAIIFISLVFLIVYKSKYRKYVSLTFIMFFAVSFIGIFLSVKNLPCFLGRYVSCIAPLILFAIAAGLNEMKMKILYVVIFLMAFLTGALVYRDRVRYEYEKGIDDYLAYAESNFTEDDAIVYADLHNDYLTVYYNENYSYIFGFKDEFNPFDNDETLTQKEQLDKVKGNVYLICFDNKNPDWFLKCEYEKTYGFHFLYYDFSIYRIYNVQ